MKVPTKFMIMAIYQRLFMRFEFRLLCLPTAVVAPDGTVTKKATKVTTKEVQNKDPLYIEPKVNKKYMMFLKKNQLFGNYYGSIEPFAIIFAENNKADLQINIETINENKMSSKAQLVGKTIVLKNERHETITDNISGKNLDELKEQVKQLIIITYNDFS